MLKMRAAKVGQIFKKSTHKHRKSVHGMKGDKSTMKREDPANCLQHLRLGEESQTDRDSLKEGYTFQVEKRVTKGQKGGVGGHEAYLVKLTGWKCLVEVNTTKFDS